MIKNNRWSILIWSLFFVVFISFSFLYMSSDILRIIKNNDFIKQQSLSYINRNKTLTWTDIEIGNWDVMNLVYLNSFTWTLAYSWTTNFSFLSTNTWSFLINSWWPIYYKTYTWSTIYSSWYIFTWATLSLSWNLYLENFWWFTKYNINFSSSSWVTFPYNYYKIEKSIWWTNILKEFGKY